MNLSNIAIGRIEALISSMLFAWIFYFIKASEHNTSQLAWVRGTFNCVFLYIHSRISKDCLFGSWKELDMVCTRGATGSNYILTASDIHRSDDAE